MRNVERRGFLTLAAGVGAALAAEGARAAASSPDAFMLHPSGAMPNNERLPVLWYRQAFVPGDDLADRFDVLFARNGWPSQWHAGIYDFHHYHSTAHEVLGCARGGTRVMLGGENGRPVRFSAGDVLVLPTGTGHRNMTPDADILVVGAYPAGQHWDICRNAPDAAARARMATLPFPVSDPVGGTGGAVPALWHRV
ncbi:cupin [Rhizosaccharibacter radicis]|uniref:Cupin n=1 Tax=Rhizosaccharibacter radicis TaxID=2782605 RepID=A0ABT1VUR9_9PROT|nr:cupin [Acetobacteraceae bacterium KSS12]